MDRAEPQPSRRPTMRDVADAAGVHHTTVSLALRNHRSLPLATRERIQAIARRIGYRPNPLISALMGSRRARSDPDRHITLAYVVSFPSTTPWRKIPYFHELFLGACSRARSLGYRLEEFQHGLSAAAGAQLDRIFRARNIHGALVAPLPHGTASLDLQWEPLAAVSLSLTFARPYLECVSNDQYLSARVAFARCRELGYRRIGFFMSGQTSSRLQHRWLAGFQLEQGLGPPNMRVRPLIYDVPDTSPPPLPALKAWLTREKPDAVLCRAVDAHALTEPGLKRLTAGLGIAAFDVDSLTGRLAGIYQNPRRIGEIGIELLVGKLQRNEYGPLVTTQNHLVAGEWVAGESLPPRR